jgi:hypothetical protein
MRSACIGSSDERGSRAREPRTLRASNPTRPKSRVNTSSSRLVSRHARACST